MLVLGIESSCDETAAAVVDEELRVCSNIISSQVDVHHEFGGVVPELASRQHILNIVSVTRRALAEAGVSASDLSGIAVTTGPGLVGALLVGLQFAKALSFVHRKPLLAVDHLLAHLESAFVRRGAPTPEFPHVCLLVSGGHTMLGVRRSPHELEVLGATRDDAAGEAFDKVAKMLGLGYPGGQVVDRLAAAGDPSAIRFPRAMRGRQEWDFSFSGLKTAVKQHLERLGPPADDQALADLCASFQEAVVEVLVTRARRATRATGLGQLVVAGGVAANSRLRAALELMAREQGTELFIPPPVLCTDNAAMVAVAGHRQLACGVFADLGLNATANWVGG
ncbi:MAG: tRNA (adenosine(37)-N6)-threonylcarbamoyltransferase complex transferase subunit TsaD [bacterium]